MQEARRLAASGRVPPPLVDSAKCLRCSLVGICLPDEIRLAVSLVGHPDDATQGLLFDELGETVQEERPLRRVNEDDELRRLIPARDDLRPLYVTGYARRFGKSGEVLQVKDKGALVREARLADISQVNVFGAVQLTASAVQGLCRAEKPIAFFSMGGWFYGITQGLGLKNVFLRRAQVLRADEEPFATRLAGALVATKIRNQRTLLQRNHDDATRLVLQRMKELADDASDVSNRERLLGIEGAAARLYFEHVGGMLRGEAGMAGVFSFEGRNRRPPRDPLNAMLSFAYAMLTKDLTITASMVGFDPFIGFFHQPRFGRPALALDLMEGFLALVADSAVLSAINTGMVKRDNFIQAGQTVSLTHRGRKNLIQAYEQRMDQLVTHSLFGYRVSYRRVLEVQTRLLARAVMDEISVYPGFESMLSPRECLGDGETAGTARKGNAQRKQR